VEALPAKALHGTRDPFAGTVRIVAARTHNIFVISHIQHIQQHPRYRWLLNAALLLSPSAAVFANLDAAERAIETRRVCTTRVAEVVGFLEVTAHMTMVVWEVPPSLSHQLMYHQVVSSAYSWMY